MTANWTVNFVIGLILGGLGVAVAMIGLGLLNGWRF